jgi:hypothetical protein
MKLPQTITTLRRARDERGDIPGWVMITVMTIVIASALMVTFQDLVTGFLDEALSQMKL